MREKNFLKKGANHLIRDRGRKKWTAMMLPEHIQQLREWQVDEKIPLRREPDEQQFEQWNYIIATAMETNTPLTITYWKGGRPVTETGIIHQFNLTLPQLRLVTKEKAHIIQLKNIENISDFE
jgi:hypothetical protein